MRAEGSERTSGSDDGARARNAVGGRVDEEALNVDDDDGIDGRVSEGITGGGMAAGVCCGDARDLGEEWGEEPEGLLREMREVAWRA